ncbi:hypothetical protein [Halomonas denitrificans]|uniref:hypothetical protein n=1 Tax=Halomonas denitrificans TaxID=370769 RepID=UPI001C99E116|nr:hypothetical protein [Halomonas denitrificans]MBY5967670.1 hypothetical protein [Halomonas denitrificans]
MSIRYDFSSQRSFTPYSDSILPTGFRYPIKYLSLSREMLYPVQFLWWFNDSTTEVGELCWRMRLHRLIDWPLSEKVDPIPFARNGELAAYFDGNDHSGDPPVFVVHLPDSVCIDRYENFDAWLAAAKEEGGIGNPPYDKISAESSYPAAAEASDGYYFCPNCYEASVPLHTYDTAILCDSCGVFFNLK